MVCIVLDEIWALVCQQGRIHHTNGNVTVLVSKDKDSPPEAGSGGHARSRSVTVMPTV